MFVKKKEVHLSTDLAPKSGNIGKYRERQHPGGDCQVVYVVSPGKFKNDMSDSTPRVATIGELYSCMHRLIDLKRLVQGYA